MSVGSRRADKQGKGGMQRGVVKYMGVQVGGRLIETLCVGPLQNLEHTICPHLI